MFARAVSEETDQQQEQQRTEPEPQGKQEEVPSGGAGGAAYPDVMVDELCTELQSALNGLNTRASPGDCLGTVHDTGPLSS